DCLQTVGFGIDFRYAHRRVPQDDPGLLHAELLPNVRRRVVAQLVGMPAVFLPPLGRLLQPFGLFLVRFDAWFRLLIARGLPQRVWHPKGSLAAADDRPAVARHDVPIPWRPAARSFGLAGRLRRGHWRAPILASFGIAGCFGLTRLEKVCFEFPSQPRLDDLLR